MGVNHNTWNTCCHEKDEFGFTFVHLKRLLPTHEQPFIFFSQIEQVFFLYSLQDPSWKVVLLKGARSRRVVGDNVDLEQMDPTKDILDI
jgi:hypothetical protein